jgi:hypothetical protein
VADKKRVAGNTGTILPQHFIGVLDFSAVAKASVDIYIYILAGHDGLNG